MAKFQFKYNPRTYTTVGAESLMNKNMREMRKEYTRMRDVAQKRIQRLGKDFDWTKSGARSYKTTDENGNETTHVGFPKISEIDPRDMAKAFKELASFVKWKGSTITGQREMQEKTSETLSKSIAGKKVMEKPPEERPVNANNYKRVIKILDEARKRKITYDSSKMVELANATLDLNSDQFDDVIDNLGVFLEHSDEVEEAFAEYGTPVDMAEFIEEIGW